MDSMTSKAFVEWLFGSMVIAAFATLIGVVVGGKGKVSEISCKERQHACTATNDAKLDAIHSDIKMIKDLYLRRREC